MSRCGTRKTIFILKRFYLEIFTRLENVKLQPAVDFVMFREAKLLYCRQGERKSVIS